MFSEIQKLKNFPDYYATLNLPFGSSRDLIKAYYYTMAKIFHPDNLKTGQRNKFEEIQMAYKVLSSSAREIYDLSYLKLNAIKKKLHESILLPQDRIIYTTSIRFLAQKGLLRAGFRKKDRAKFTGLQHDIDLLIKKEEILKRVSVKIPLVVRILCPQCRGSDIHCECCNGIGNYKSTRSLQLNFDPEQIVNNRVYEFELSRFRPDNFIHFKKKKLKLKIEVQ